MVDSIGRHYLIGDDLPTLNFVPIAKAVVPRITPIQRPTEFLYSALLNKRKSTISSFMLATHDFFPLVYPQTPVCRACSLTAKVELPEMKFDDWSVLVTK